MLPADIKKRIDSMIGVPYTYGNVSFTLKQYEVNEERGRVYFYTEEGNSNDRSFEGVTGFLDIMVKGSKVATKITKQKEPNENNSDSDKDLVIRIEPKLRQQLQKLADNDRRKLSRYVIIQLEELVDKHNTNYEKQFISIRTHLITRIQLRSMAENSGTSFEKFTAKFLAGCVNEKCHTE